VASHDACEARQASSLPQIKPVSPFLPPVANVDVEATSTPSLLHRSEMDVEPQHHRSHMAPDPQSLERHPPGDSNLGSGLQSAAVPEFPPAQADMEHSRPPVPHTEIWLPPPLPTPSILVQPDITCTICCERFARDQEQTAIAYPCQCEAAYCTSCLKDMFVKACKDVSDPAPLGTTISHKARSRRVQAKVRGMEHAESALLSRSDLLHLHLQQAAQTEERPARRFASWTADRTECIMPQV
jgi:hypothetical protein